MRMLFAAALLAGVAVTPSLADDPHKDPKEQPPHKEAQADHREVRQDHAQIRQDRAEGHPADVQRDRAELARDRGAPQHDQAAHRPGTGDRPDDRGGHPGFNGPPPGPHMDRGYDRPGGRDMNDGPRDPRNHFDNRPAGRPGGAWSRGWRDDHRFDWRGYRASHPGVFRGPRFYAPHGYAYRRFSVGYRFAPVFYGEDYWIADPWMYRLPPTYWPYRWVRYYDDVALVDIRDGMIVDMIYDFFD